VPAYLGEQLRRARLTTRLRQIDVAAAAGVSQSLVSRMECGTGGQVPIETWLAIAAAVGADFVADLLTKHAAAIVDEPRMRMIDLVVGLATLGGWVADRSMVVNADDSIRDISLTLRHLERRSTAVVRAWDVIPSTDAVLADLDRAVAHASDRNAEDAIGGLIVVRPSPSNRRRITEGSEPFDRRFPDSGSRWIGTLTRPTRQRLPPDGMLWVDEAVSRLIPTRLYLQHPRNPKPRRQAA